MEPSAMSLADAGRLIESKELSPVELVGSMLERIGEHDAAIGAFASVQSGDALVAARQASDEIVHGRYRGPLHGIPFGLKDLIDVVGVPTAANSSMNGDRVAPADATVTGLLREAGAVFVGKTRTHEFASGITTPGTNNPWDLRRIPGGSSGGSGAALTARLCHGALGTDTGGSIRIPAALCGVVGLKPTYGRVSSTGVTPLSWSLDHVGPMGRTVTDVALIQGVIGRYDSSDPASVDVPGGISLGRVHGGVRGIVIGFPRSLGNVETDVLAAYLGTLDALRDAGAILQPVDNPASDSYGAAIVATSLSESAAYQHRDIRERGHLFGAQVRTLLEVGGQLLAVDYINAQRYRSVVKDEWQRALVGVDAYVTPTVPSTALIRGEETLTWEDGSEEDMQAAYLRLLSPGSMTGLPTLSVPSGLSSENLPMAVQVMGRPFDEQTVLQVGYGIEQARGILPTPTL